MKDRKPDILNGYAKLANDVLEALAMTQMSGYQTRCLFFLFRKTYGWGKKADVISLSQWVKGTSLKKPHVSRTLGELLTRRIITKIGNEWAFNKHYQQWRALPKLVTKKALPELVKSVTKIGNLPLPKLGHTKESFLKETKTKEKNVSGEKTEKQRDFKIITMQGAGWEFLASTYAWPGESMDAFLARARTEYKEMATRPAPN